SARTGGGLRCSGQMVVSNRGLPHLHDRSDQRVGCLSTRATRDANSRQCACVLLTAQHESHSRSLTRFYKGVNHGTLMATRSVIIESNRKISRAGAANQIFLRREGA